MSAERIEAAALDDAIRRWADEQHLADAHLRRWLGLSDDDRAALLEIAETLRMRTGQFVTTFELLEEIALRERATTVAIETAVVEDTNAEGRIGAATIGEHTIAEGKVAKGTIAEVKIAGDAIVEGTIGVGTIGGILARGEIRRIAEGSGSGPGRARELIETLRAIRFPRLKRMENRLNAEIAALELPRGVKV